MSRYDDCPLLTGLIGFTNPLSTSVEVSDSCLPLTLTVPFTSLLETVSASVTITFSIATSFLNILRFIVSKGDSLDLYMVS